MSDVCLVAGFVLAILGVYLTLGQGYACLIAGVTLMLAGGLDGRKRLDRRPR